MKIYSMTATFGKLENHTLTFEPGLNVIHAPNEWGKSTWCAFLCAMLYGIDTRERTTQTFLAAKERYAPWSGSPMSGRLDLCWNGKDITIERSTKGRAIMGDFRAYETATGLPVPELRGENCGEVLLGVEKNVFTRSAFIRLTDLPVTQDDALRRRLNALVTTGDENDAGDKLAQKLKDLKNKCRHNKTGLLPQAEAQRADIAEKLAQLRTLQEQTDQIRQKQAHMAERIQMLENHRDALAYEAAKEDAQRLACANAARDDAAAKLAALTDECAALPGREDAQNAILQLEQLRMQQEALQAEQLPSSPEKPVAPAIFAGITPEQALHQANSDRSAYMLLCKPISPVYWILASLCLAIGIGLLFVTYLATIPAVLLAVFFAALYLRNKNTQAKDRASILSRYNSPDPEDWVASAQAYVRQTEVYKEKEAAYNAVSDSYCHRKAALYENIEQFTYGASIGECLDGWRETLSRHDAMLRAQETYIQAKHHADTLSAMVKTAPAPAVEDNLTCTPSETERLLTEAAAEYRQLQLHLGQYIGQMEALGQEDNLNKQLSAIQNRIDTLEDTYRALELSLTTLASATEELQRRFAPRIAQRAQELFGRLTGSRYDRLQLTQDLHVQAGAQGEITLHDALWRSDGTVDQLYLALRLAVSEALTPQAPLILDDAFVRFDDTRLGLAMEILKDCAKNRQVILFSCQQRESGLLQ